MDFGMAARSIPLSHDFLHGPSRCFIEMHKSTRTDGAGYSNAVPGPTNKSYKWPCQLKSAPIGLMSTEPELGAL
jgi:hypothetical protein